MNPSWDCASTVRRITIGAALWLGSGAFAWPQASNAAADCAEISNDADRLRCYDRRAERAQDVAAAPDEEQAVSIWVQRALDDATRRPFTLTALKPNYILPITHNTSPNEAPFKQLDPNAEADNEEVKFQLSFQTKMGQDLFGTNGDLWFGYTQVSYWQLYNDDFSSPFRDTSYEPEAYFSFLTGYPFFGLTGRVINFGFVHQSNGRGEPLSRSWNRVYAEFLLDRGNLVLSFKPWVRINESSADDDNPDITDFLGHYELRAAYKWRQQLFSVMVRNVFDSEHRYNSELMWSFPIKAHLRGLVQWYNGYGESLIDYNHNNHRIGIGLLMTDWL